MLRKGAAQAMGWYAERFAETGSLDKVDAVSGATVSHGQFVEAAAAALKRARE